MANKNPVQATEGQALNREVTEPSSGFEQAGASGHGRWSDFVKSAFDKIVVVVTAPLWVPLVFILGTIVRLGDGGPMFFRRRVVGCSEDFDAFKLRSMRIDADAWLARDPALLKEYQRNFKLQDDPRVTKVGRALRKYSLDEIPQLWNVLRGEMSLVGPRMVTAPELEKYGPFRRQLLSVKPGLTGYWQVSGRQNVSYEERVKMDLFYIQNHSLWFDLKILLKTVWKVVTREGAF